MLQLEEIGIDESDVLLQTVKSKSSAAHFITVPKKSSHLWFQDTFKSLRKTEKVAKMSNHYESVRVSWSSLESSLPISQVAVNDKKNEIIASAVHHSVLTANQNTQSYESLYARSVIPVAPIATSRSPYQTAKPVSFKLSKPLPLPRHPHRNLVITFFS